MAMGSHKGVKQGRKGVRFSWKCLFGARVEVGRGKTRARNLWVSSGMRLGRTTLSTGVALTPRKEAVGTIFTVCKCLNLHGEDSLENQLASQFLKMGVECRTISEEQASV